MPQHLTNPPLVTPARLTHTLPAVVQQRDNCSDKAQCYLLKPAHVAVVARDFGRSQDLGQWRRSRQMRRREGEAWMLLADFRAGRIVRTLCSA